MNEPKFIGWFIVDGPAPPKGSIYLQFGHQLWDVTGVEDLNEFFDFDSTPPVTHGVTENE